MRTLLVSLVAVALAASCSSGPANKANSTPDPSRSPAATSRASRASNPAGNETTTTDANGVASPAVSPGPGVLNRKIVKGAEVPGPSLPPAFVPADENSEFGMRMDEQGRPVEVRVFKGKSPVVRVESTFLDAKKRSLSITLQGGKIVQVTTDELPSLKAATTAQMLQLARSAN
jgi:hypothetical protein